MKFEKIGTTCQGIDGADLYCRFDLNEQEQDEIPQEKNRLLFVDADLRLRFYRQSLGPGQQFCTSFTVVPMPHSPAAFIGIAHIRFDV